MIPTYYFGDATTKLNSLSFFANQVSCIWINVEKLIFFWIIVVKKLNVFESKSFKTISVSNRNTGFALNSTCNFQNK